MINIRPVSDLKNNIEQYSAIINDIEHKLDEADEVAENFDVRYSASKVFGKVRSRINARKKE